jgi:single-stranded DNA-binding protein
MRGMIDGLVSGRIHGAPTERTTKAGKPFATAKLRVALRDGATQFVNVIAFDEVAVDALLALSDRDSVAIAGELTVGVYEPENGAARPTLDLLAHSVLTEYHVARKRKAVRGGNAPLPFDDELPGAA